jgi:hypothetical protein
MPLLLSLPTTLDIMTAGLTALSIMDKIATLHHESAFIPNVVAPLAPHQPYNAPWCTKGLPSIALV